MNDVEDFDAFYEATRTRLFQQMYAMTGNLADAQDCVQEAFARAWQHWGDVRGHDDPEAWLRTVAWRVAASRWRKLRNGVAAMTRHGPPAPPAEPHPERIDLLTALKEIPEKQRRALVLHHMIGHSVEEIARETGTPTGTIKARLSRGRRALAELLEPDELDGHVPDHANDGKGTANRPNVRPATPPDGQPIGPPDGQPIRPPDGQSDRSTRSPGRPTRSRGPTGEDPHLRGRLGGVPASLALNGLLAQEGTTMDESHHAW